MNNHTLIESVLNPFLDESIIPDQEMISEKIIEEIIRFHHSLPDYQTTLTVSLASLAEKLNVKKLYVKDESQRFDLNAFKVLGASYAMAKILANHLNWVEKPLIFSEILKCKNEYRDLVFITTTDGNHGRAVAWAAQKFGCRAVVYMPSGSSLERLKAIQSFGAEAYISELGYDDCVEFTYKLAAENHWNLIQDTAWSDYQDIPRMIMQGYFSLLTEFEQQYPNAWPTHVFLQAGVGSLAAAIAIFLWNRKDKIMPIVIVVEPKGAPCFYDSIKINDGKPYRTEAELKTMMAGLACGEPSSIAWGILKSLSHAFLICEDQVSVIGMRRLAEPLGNDEKMISGESGAVTLGAIQEIMLRTELSSIRKELQLDNKSKVLLFSTEGDTDSKIYKSIVG